MESITNTQSLRLASGIEMQQRWSMPEKVDFSNTIPRLIDVNPTKGNQGSMITVIIQHPNPLLIIKLAFNNLLVETKQMHSQGIISLVAIVPPFAQIQSTTSNVPVSVCFLENDSISETWPMTEFYYDFNNTDECNYFYYYNNTSTPTTPTTPSFNYNNNKYYSFNYNQLLNSSNADFTEILNTEFNLSPTPPKTYQKKSVIPATSVANYQPYPGLVSRTNLNLVGDLDTMTENWSSQEWDQGRRLVQFWREQDTNEIRCTFEPIKGVERHQDIIVVSCIYWAERNDYFITSVDCIHLLESIMDIKFSVEEKNRVRRNLEGFRPLTVSKCKSESANFFKLIMGFPNPKPRHIEKDVKVFPWKTLPYALKKIITKYTAYRRPQLKSSKSFQQHHQSIPSTPTHPYPSTAPTTPNIIHSSSSYFPSTPNASYHQQDYSQHASLFPESFIN